MDKLQLNDILDLREYERVRDEYLKYILDLKRIRRIAVGPFISLVFENAETMKFQVQEMARAEKIIDDKLLQDELDIYNPLIPGKGEISITLLLELTSKEDLYRWLPQLVGIEKALYLDLIHSDHESESLQMLSKTSQLPDNYEVREDNGYNLTTVHAEIEKSHEESLTRSDITSSVHYLRFVLNEQEQTLFRKFENSEAAIRISHQAYKHQTKLSDQLKNSIISDW